MIPARCRVPSPRIGRLARRRWLSTEASADVDVAALQAQMRARSSKAMHDVLSPMSSHLLNVSLSDFIPAACDPPGFDRVTRLPPSPPAAGLALPQGHHLVYFPLQAPASRLLSDGTDPDHAPGPPFSRRMWAGGSVRFAPGWDRALQLDGRRAVCHESIGDVALKARGKLFVDVWRRYAPVGSDFAAAAAATLPVAIEEKRSLVFLSEALTPSGKVVKAPYKPDYSIQLTPTPTLLFHFSALTFNAHAIHLDPQFCRDVEGHRGLLVHGPLSLALMFSVLRSQLREGEYVESIEYRNLAPLYAGEPMSVCARKNAGSQAEGLTRWDVWVEGPQGGLAVKATATSRL